MMVVKAGAFEKLVKVLLQDVQQGPVPTEAEIRAAAAEARVVRPVTDEVFSQVLLQLHTSLQVSMDTGDYVIDEDTYTPWLSGRKASIDPYYWTRYKDHLELNKGWNERVVDTLGRVTDEILDYLGNPENPKPWQRRGLVLGDVQSGKTATYTALINKAVDAGYRVIILLTGIQENLRRQTQERLDEDFVGQDSRQLLLKQSQPVHARYIGVGGLDSRRKAAALTTVIKDFNSKVNYHMRLKDYNEPILFVLKKNKTVLESLETWLRMHNLDSTGKIDLPLLLIDDEADNASVNTRAEEDPTTINKAIRNMLSLFNRGSYVAVTATPFANIFIHPDTKDEMIGDDLFPKHFIYSLKPPTNYIGNTAIFSTDSVYGHSLREIVDAEDFFPLKHKSSHMVEDLPDSLWEALRYFLLVNVIRDVRGQTGKHRSMLVNVSRFTAVQDQVAVIIQNWLDKLHRDINAYSALSQEEACRIQSIKSLRQTWEKYSLSEVSGISWIDAQHMLRESLITVFAKSVNQRTGAASLDYKTHQETGLRVIAVGGNSLSRGLTLEGLCVSYFYRNSRMYDTLLQMGRWFGYRDGYSDLCRIWMSDEAVSWYSYITEATTELRQAIRRMNSYHMSPEHFGLKVREHPDSLIVTARNKMRHTKYEERLISVSGKLLETPRLHHNTKILQANKTLTEQFVSKIESMGCRVTSSGNEILWKGVPKDSVAAFLRMFATHPTHLPFQSEDIARFIESAGHLGDWDVVIPTGKGREYSLVVDGNQGGGESILYIPTQQRSITVDSGTISVSGKHARVGSRGCTKAGLSVEQIELIETQYKAENGEKKSPSDDVYLVEGRNPLLILHLIDGKKSDEPEGEPLTLVALGVAFPRFDDFEDNKKARYVVNLVEARQLFGADEEEDDDVEIY